MDYISQAPKRAVGENGLIFATDSLSEYLRKITDNRQAKGKRNCLATLLLVMILAKMSGEDKPSGICDWVTERVRLLKELKILKRPRAPSHMTYRRVLQHIFPADEWDQLLHDYHQQRLKTEKEILITIDGKTVRGTIPQGEMRGTHLLTVYVPEQGLALVQAQVDQKENEIVVAPQVLKQVNLEGAIVIGDAMHTQRVRREIAWNHERRRLGGSFYGRDRYSQTFDTGCVRLQSDRSQHSRDLDSGSSLDTPIGSCIPATCSAWRRNFIDKIRSFIATWIAFHADCSKLAAWNCSTLGALKILSIMYPQFTLRTRYVWTSVEVGYSCQPK